MTYLIKMIAPNYPDAMKIPFEYKKEDKSRHRKIEQKSVITVYMKDDVWSRVEVLKIEK